MTSVLPRDRLAQAVAAARPRVALVAYLTAGHPRLVSFRNDVAVLAAAADVVEIGVPFSDPMADGVTIQRSSEVALKQGVSLRWILSELTAMPRMKAPLVLMSYLNPLLAYGLDALALAAANAGVTGFIVPDLPIEESAPMRAALDKHGLALVQMVTPVTPFARLQQLCAAAQGFVYAVTMTGTTGKSVRVPPETREYLQRAREFAKVPVCAGFGIRSREHVELLQGLVDGVIVGSAIVETLEKGDSPAALLASLR
ncbi:MAG: tryptophan synthase subunit alpha [Steroidobacteraceae bacterium]